MCLKYSALSSAVNLNSEAHCNRSISRTYVILLFGTTGFSQMGFYNKRNVKMGRVAPINLFWPMRKDTIIIREKFTKKIRIKMLRVIWIVSSIFQWPRTNPWIWMYLSLQSAEKKPLLLLQNFLIESKYPHNPLLGLVACCSYNLMSSNTLMPASINPSHLFNFKTAIVLSLGSGSVFSSSSTAHRFRILREMSIAIFCSWKFSKF